MNRYQTSVSISTCATTARSRSLWWSGMRRIRTWRRTTTWTRRWSSRPGRGVIENKHSTDVESRPPPSRSCMSIHTQSRSCSDVGRVIILNDPPAWRGRELARVKTDKEVWTDRQSYVYRRVIRCRLAQETKVVSVLDDLADHGPGIYCSSRHDIPCHSRNEGLQCG
jgi:hypothetical protein